MLEFLRRNAQSVFFQIIVVIIILAFVFWGGSSMMNSRESAITVNKEEVTFQEVDSAYNKAYNQMAAQFGGQIPKGLAESLNIKGQVINQLIRDSLLRQGADQMGVVVSANEIQTEILSMVQFLDNGVFNEDKYKEILASNRLSPAKFEESMKRDLLAQKTIADIGNFIAAPTEFEIDNLYFIENEEVSVDFIKTSPDTFAEKAKPTAEELDTWFESRKDNYKTAPQFKLDYLSFSYDDLARKTTIEDGDIEQYYQNNISQYQTPESRHARHILFKADSKDSDEVHAEKKAQAEEALATLKNGGDFIELAKTLSEGPSGPSGGDLGFFGKNQMVPEFDSAVFSLQPGEISEVVKTAFGYHLIKVEEVKEAITKPLEEVKDNIVQTLSMNQAKPMAFQFANQAYEGIIGAGSLAAYAAQNGEVEVISTDFFAQATPPEALKGQTDFLTKAFALNKGELSSLIETPNGYAIIFASDVKNPETPALETVKEKVEQDYITEKSVQLAEEAAKAMIAKLSENGDLTAAVEGTSYSLENSGFFTKSAPNADSSLPTALTSQAFKLSSAQPFSQEPAQVGSDFYVLHLKERKAPAKEMSAEEKERYEQTLIQLKQQQLLSSWIKNQEEDTVITIHKSLN